MKIFFIPTIVTSIIILLSNGCLAQKNIKVEFSFRKLSEPSDAIRLIVKNTSSTEKYFYSIFLSGYRDTSWVSLLSDINSLGMNEFTALKPLLPGRKQIKDVSKAKIKRMYDYENLTKIRFGVMIYKKQSFRSEGETILLDPIDL